jgi:single-strand DNA-binding protein
MTVNQIMYNNAVIIGRLGKDPESKQFDQNTKTWFSIASSERYKDRSGERKEVTQWHNIVIWGKLAETAQKYLKKGDLLLVSGKIEYRSYDKDGQTRYITEIVVDKMTMLGGGGQKQAEESTLIPDNNDLPF